ncbi:hypothetical protein FACS1894187_17880 [Synergistales bacterium]|nr:hypothetical protein FACS1894187_17880 [Synergistales bacterium]
MGDLVLLINGEHAQNKTKSQEEIHYADFKTNPHHAAADIIPAAHADPHHRTVRARAADGVRGGYKCVC